MRKLLSLLTVLTLTVQVPLNVVACGGKANPIPDTNETDYLTLDFTCLGENSKVNTTIISKTYDMYFANDGSDLNQVVDFITNKIQEELKSIGTVKLEYPQWNDSFINRKDDVLEKIKDAITNQQKIKKLTIDTQTIANPYNNDYNYMNYYGLTTRVASSEIYDNFPLTLPESQKFINNSTDFNKAWKPIVTARENNFVSRLKEWEIKNNVQISDNKNVFVFGEYQTRNWKINGLEIKSLSIQYYITSNDTTRASNTSESLKILENLFVGPDALFKYNKNYMIVGKNFYNFNIELNPDIYDNFMKNDVTIQTVYEYVTQQTKDFLTKNSFIKPTDKVQWTANNTDWLNTSIKNALVNGSSSQNFRLIINGNAFAMSLFANGYTSFTISRSNTDVWPTT